MTNEEQMWLSAIRYALGRRTYIVGITTEFITDQGLSEKLSEHFKEIAIRDIEEAFERCRVGDDCDRKNWEELLEFLKR